MPNRLPDINLLPNQDHDPSKHYHLFIGLVVVLIIAYGLLGFYYFSTKSKLSESQSTVSELRQENALLTLEIEQLTPDTSSSGSDLLAFIEQYDVVTSAFIEEIDALLPKDSALHTYVYENNGAEINVYFNELEDVAAYTTELTASDFTKDVKVRVVDAISPEDNESPHYETTFIIDISRDSLRGERVTYE